MLLLIFKLDQYFDMKLQRLTGLEREKIDTEFKEIEALIKELREVSWR